MISSKLKALTHFHIAGRRESVVVFSSPRGGSTWISELIAALPGFWPVGEPFNVRKPVPARELGLTSYGELYASANRTRIENYYEALLAGKITDFKLRPGQANYRPLTSRLVVKQNQYGLDRIEWFAQRFRIKPVHLIRNPIAVALSREVLLLLPDFKNCELRDRFSWEQLSFADRLIDRGSHLEQGVLAWCLHHAPALWDHKPDWFVISYEHCLLEPEKTLDALARFLGEGNLVERMQKKLSKPSKVIRKSDKETQAMVSNHASPLAIAQKWRKKVDRQEASDLLGILKVFSLNTYIDGDDLPHIQLG